MKLKTLTLERYCGNPILEASDNPWENLNVSNAGAAVYNGKVMLLYRAEGRERRKGPESWPVTRLGLAVSSDGYHFERLSDQPVFVPDPDNLWYRYGVEDPRISRIGDTYYIVIAGSGVLGQIGDVLLLSTTKDFQHFTPLRLLMPELEQRTSGLLPALVNGEYLLYHRPMPNMWSSRSADLEHWHDMRCMLQIKPGTWYGQKLGLGAPPLWTPYGWVMFWHGKSNDGYYSLGVLLLAPDNPDRIIKIQREPILRCEKEYERKGYFDNVVYTNGAVEFQDQIIVYYGCADRCLSAASISVDELHSWCTEPGESNI